MDLNIKLIEGIKRNPLLFKQNASVEERQQGWRQLSQQMKVEEPILKSRWHFLCEFFKHEHVLANRAGQQQSHVAFGKNTRHILKYKPIMQTLLPQLYSTTGQQQQQRESDVEECLPNNVIKPEFVITEKDLEMENDNDEFVFLEVETLECGTDEGEHQETAHTETHTLEEQIQKQKEQDQEKQQQHEVTEQNNENEKLTKSKNQKPTEKNPAAAVDIVEKLVVKSEAPNSDDGESNNDDAQKSTTDSTTFHERCEDIIFGELVTAMIKGMPAEKKRAIKKDIMNILLT